MTLLILYLALAIGVSFLCSILEAALLSITPSYIQLLDQQKHKSAEKLQKLKANIDQPLAAILSLNTIAHTIGAAGVGAQAQIVFGNAYVTITSIVLTLLILVFSEIIPKTIGATYWKSLAGFTGWVTGPLITITYPFVLLSKGITKIIAGNKSDAVISREEISAMAELGYQEGIFEEEESNIFKNLIRFNSLRVEDIMTPRIVVIRFSQSDHVSTVLSKDIDLTVSRIPIYGKNDEDITGYILKNDLYLNLSQGKGDIPLSALKRNILFVPETNSIKHLLEQLLESQEHIAAVVDEYGGFSGVVTMEDVVETLLGMEIVDEADAIDDMQKLARQKWRERAKRLGLPLPEDLTAVEDSTDEG